jgi:hypothetical protein
MQKRFQSLLIISKESEELARGHEYNSFEADSEAAMNTLKEYISTVSNNADRISQVNLWAEMMDRITVIETYAAMNRATGGEATNEGLSIEQQIEYKHKIAIQKYQQRRYDKAFKKIT